MRVNRTLAFSLGLLLASVVGVAWFLHGPERGSAVAWPVWLADSEPVLVVVLGRPGGAVGVRAVVPSDRIVAESATAFAVRERRVVAESFEGVGPVLMAAGWRDAPLEIVALRPRAPVPLLAGDPVERVEALMRKPSLNLLEARALLGTL